MGLVAVAGAAVADGAVLVDELPRVGVVAERELQDPEGGEPHRAVGERCLPRVEAATTGTDDDLLDAVRARRAVGQLRIEPLVAVLVTDEVQLRAVVLERGPERSDGSVAVVGGEPR